MQTFDIVLSDVTKGAVLGIDRRLRVGILASDASVGVFSITPHQVSALCLCSYTEKSINQSVN